MVVYMRHRNVEWARLWLEDGITTLFGYLIKRNNDFGIDSNVYDLEEEYAVLRQTMSKREIERFWNVEISFKKQHRS